MSDKKDYVIYQGEDICGIRRASEAAARVRDQLPAMVRPGMSTKEIDNIAAALIHSIGGVSAFLGYRGYPGQICISVNDEVVHGIGRPDRFVNNGDLVSLDIGVNIGGYIGDTAVSFVLGGTNDPDTLRLLNNTRRALEEGMKAAVAGNYVKNISAAVEKVAKSAKLGIVREYCGHGCGKTLHDPPEIPNYVSFNRGPQLRPGMVLAIEPMLNLGTSKVITESDGWTVRTSDGKLSAHFEHMVLITESKPEILTWLK
ncbi:MAG TPA: type I methionyl aminopeptidase [Lentisphaeria bacterium]|nr:MAG: type I methionyl aminopeptidase [Lentisphaerae bacterium GWF2_50_93]HCE46980.1 type I methionyl aminopeptidase [Lentisphaeria bacterium]